MIKGYVPDLDKTLGIFIPLIVVNCMILGRAEAFASKNSVSKSVADALGIGLGFLISLAMISLIREVIGSGSLWGIPFTDWSKLTDYIQPIGTFAQAPGAFITVGILVAFFKWLKLRKKASPPVCNLGGEG